MNLQQSNDVQNHNTQQQQHLMQLQHNLMNINNSVTPQLQHHQQQQQQHYYHHQPMSSHSNSSNVTIVNHVKAPLQYVDLSLPPPTQPPNRPAAMFHNHSEVCHHLLVHSCLCVLQLSVDIEKLLAPHIQSQMYSQQRISPRNRSIRDSLQWIIERVIGIQATTESDMQLIDVMRGSYPFSFFLF